MFLEHYVSRFHDARVDQVGRKPLESYAIKPIVLHPTKVHLGHCWVFEHDRFVIRVIGPVDAGPDGRF